MIIAVVFNSGLSDAAANPAEPALAIAKPAASAAKEKAIAAANGLTLLESMRESSSPDSAALANPNGVTTINSRKHNEKVEYDLCISFNVNQQIST